MDRNTEYTKLTLKIGPCYLKIPKRTVTQPTVMGAQEGSGKVL